MLAALVSARRKLVETTHQENSAHTEVPHSVDAPQVMDTQFILGSSQYYWKLDMTPPTLTVGWETDQSANTQALTF